MAAVLLAAGYATLQVSKSRSFQFFGDIVQRAETEEKVVALTFDDAPTDRTESVLEILDELDVKATFFVIGEALKQNPQIGRRIVEDGHELGNHSYSHQRMVFKTPSFISAEIEKTDVLIRMAGHRGTVFFRPPNGKKLLLLPWYLGRHGRTTIMWDVEPETYLSTDASANEIARYAVNSTRPGSIILLHPLASSAVESRKAIPTIVGTLRRRGYRFVTISLLTDLEERLR